MTPNIPIPALAIFGEAVSKDGQWGGVPWVHGITHAEPLEGMRNGCVTVFPFAKTYAVLAVTDSDNDLDGPPRKLGQVDPCYEPDTALRYPNGVSCDSRAFPGVVISPLLEKLGVRLGDFCLVSWNGAVRSAQVYDIGPTRKAGENSICLNRGLGIVPADKSDRWAAEVGHDAQDVCTLIFAGSGPGHALPTEVIIAGAHACWEKFTGRAAGGSGGKSIPAAAPTTSGSVGLAAPLCLAAICAAASFLADAGPSVDQLGKLAQLAFWLVAIVGGIVGIAVGIKQLRRKPHPPTMLPQPLIVTEAKEYALVRDLAAHKEHVEMRLKEQTAYLHEQIHLLNGTLQDISNKGDLGRENLARRMDAFAEVVHHMRGRLDTLNPRHVAATA